MFEVHTRIAGIPAIIQVNEYQTGSFSRNAASDIDYYGYCDYTICDRKGYHAPWLERKANEDEILEAIEEHLLKERIDNFLDDLNS